ncbi:MAG: DUF3179 domain-containing protein [Flavobacteriaceae bacterium]|nr:DUF3179 domain-containing protein [Flavobacteriaceae bacterium]
MKKILLVTFVATIAISCSGGSSGNVSSVGNNSNNGGSSSNSSNWLIPINQVKDGGPGKDGIPSIDSPIFANANTDNINFINDTDLIIGIVKDGVTKAYPHFILDWHEVVNDNLNGNFTTISYCPLTGTSFGWKSKSNGSKTSFGVSGLLYNANLILYDRKTDSNWSQLRLEAVNGTLIGNKPTLVNVVETNWRTWKSLYPNTQILTTNTGFSRNYDRYPYGDYKTNQDFFIFEVSPLNNALPHKERVYAIMTNTKSVVYRFQNFSNGKALKQSFEGKDYLVVGNADLINSFELNTSQASLNYTFSFNNSEAFFTDDEGNTWDVFGKAISGPRTGEHMKGAKSVVSYWFAIAAFYPNPIINQ